MFENREEAGRMLAPKVKQFLKNELQQSLVLALPRGGVPVAYEIAKILHLPLDVLIVRKIGAPFHPEYGIGAMTEGNYSWIDEKTAIHISATSEQIQEIMDREREEIKIRVEKYRLNRPLPSFQGRTIILVDDGLATGVTARVAARYVKSKGANRVFLVSPVCAQETASELREEIDQVICWNEPELFFSVSMFYKDFEQVSDENVISLLARARHFSEFEKSSAPSAFSRSSPQTNPFHEDNSNKNQG